MPQSLVKNLIHLVYTIRDRQPMITTDVQPGLYAYQIGIFGNLECHVVAIGGTNNHVHTLFELSKNYALKKVIEDVKKDSSKWIKTQPGILSDFYWQSGYGAFSVSHSQMGKVVRYIKNQEKHHKIRTVKEELCALFEKHQIPYDERFL